MEAAPPSGDPELYLETLTYLARPADNNVWSFEELAKRLARVTLTLRVPLLARRALGTARSEIRPHPFPQARGKRIGPTPAGYSPP